ncbi:uncharacterized protein LOC131656801 [Vicia villosa]|uniref:uncharacterized protein LOC131656801 n=1 Tax=Vicia villosa TaxID=3911 RepID=UPI00273BD9CA|nr:uncharacterized protein LOC131656801 [Vicia villosa]
MYKIKQQFNNKSRFTEDLPSVRASEGDIKDLFNHLGENFGFFEAGFGQICAHVLGQEWWTEVVEQVVVAKIMCTRPWTGVVVRSGGAGCSSKDSKRWWCAGYMGMLPTTLFPFLIETVPLHMAFIFVFLVVT